MQTDGEIDLLLRMGNTEHIMKSYICPSTWSPSSTTCPLYRFRTTNLPLEVLKNKFIHLLLCMRLTSDSTGELQINQNARHNDNHNDGYCRKDCAQEHFEAKQFDNVCIVNGHWLSHWTWFFAIDARARWKSLIVSLKSLINRIQYGVFGVSLTYLERFVAFSRFGGKRILRLGISVIYEEWNVNIFNWIAHILIPPFWRTCIRIV